MIICVCRRLNDQAVRDAVAAGARCPASVQAHHGCRFNCGKCREAIDDVISRETGLVDAGAAMVPAE